ncbi:hypothetical protein Tcan_01347, partial [Toxocara canis]
MRTAFQSEIATIWNHWSKFIPVFGMLLVVLDVCDTASREIIGRPRSNKYFKSAIVSLLSFFDAALKAFLLTNFQTPLASAVFDCCNVRTRSSIVSKQINLKKEGSTPTNDITDLCMKTFFVCPMRYMRSQACCSRAGFQWRSTKNRWLPPTRFRPTPPAVSDSNITCAPAPIVLKLFTRGC